MENLKKILKNKNVWIILIVVFLIVLYIVTEKILNNNNLEIEQDNEIISNQENTNENIEINLTEESVNEIEEENIAESESTHETQNTQEIQDEQEDKQIYKNAENNEKIYVYITGEVNNPGVVLLNSGSRIVDAIEAAGGVTNKANISKVNLVYVLQDGMKVNIPNNTDLKNNENFEYITMSSGDEKNDANTGNSSTTITSESSSSKNESAFKISIVNINTATQTELETLPGIGPSLALRIVNYRKENGKFSSIEDIKNVSGIGEAKYEDIKNYIKI